MSRLRTKKQIKSKENSINQKKTQKSRIKNQSNKKQLKLWWKMLIKTHFIVTMDPFCNIFTFNFFYHSKSHSMTMNIWTFEKEMTESHQSKLLRAKSPHAWTHSWVWTPCTSPAPTSPFSSSLFALSIYEPRKKKFIDLCHSLCVV